MSLELGNKASLLSCSKFNIQSQTVIEKYTLQTSLSCVPVTLCFSALSSITILLPSSTFFHHLLSFSSLFSRLKRAASYDTASLFSTDDDTVPYIYGTQFDEREDFLVSNEVEQEEEEEEEEEEEDEPEEDDDEGLRFETENIIPHCAQITHVFPCVIHNLVYWVTGKGVLYLPY